MSNPRRFISLLWIDRHGNLYLRGANHQSFADGGVWFRGIEMLNSCARHHDAWVKLVAEWLGRASVGVKQPKLNGKTTRAPIHKLDLEAI